MLGVSTATYDVLYIMAIVTIGYAN